MIVDILGNQWDGKCLACSMAILKCTLIQEERSGHFHMWILPRYKWMKDLFDNSLSSIRPMIKYAKENLKLKIILMK